jgi:hypothetical protein
LAGMTQWFRGRRGELFSQPPRSGPWLFQVPIASVPARPNSPSA